MLRRLTDDEKPLQLCLRWSDDGGADSLNRRQFVLQDNVTSDIAVRFTTTTNTVIKVVGNGWRGSGDQMRGYGLSLFASGVWYGEGLCPWQRLPRKY